MKTYPALTLRDARRVSARFGSAPRTQAVPVLPPDPLEDVWLAERRRRIGASELAAVLGISPYASPFSLWWSKQEGWDTEQTDGMKIGHKLEPVVAELFAEQRPDVTVCRSGAGLWQHPVHQWLSCTPDFLAVAAYPFADPAIRPRVVIEPVECKSDEGGAGWGQPGSDQIPTHHRVQLLVQCLLLGADRGHLVRLAGKRFTAYTIELDARALSDLATWVEVGEEFMDSLHRGQPPDVDGHEATTEAIARLHPNVDEDAREFVPAELVDAYERLDDELKVLKGRFAEAQNRVRLALGHAKTGLTPEGREFVTHLVYKRRGYEVPPGMVDQLRRKKKST